MGALHPREARAVFPAGVIACVASTHPTCYWVRKALDSDGDGHLDGRRIFIYDGNQIVLDFRRANSEDVEIGHLRQRYLWGPAVDQILADERVFPLPVGEGQGEGLGEAAIPGQARAPGEGSTLLTVGTVLWPLTDHLGAVRDLARYDPESAKSAIVDHLTYDAFGRTTGQSNPAVRQAGGNYQRIVNAGRIIGVDRVTGKPTSVYTIITNAAGDLITAFPGTP